MTRFIALRDRTVILGGAMLAALLLLCATVAPAFAEVGDGDGWDGDEISTPLIVLAALAVLIVGSFAYVRRRRS